MTDDERKLVLRERKEVADGTTAFWFETTADFLFRAGQWIDITLNNPKYRDDGGTTRTFSIASSPHHVGKFTVVMRNGKSAFKRSLRELAIGDEVKLAGLGGSFVLPPLEVGRPKVAEATRQQVRATSNEVPEKSDKHIVMIAGGIGIAPMRSMVELATHKKSQHHITLLYSNRTPGEAAFLDELRGWETENSPPHPESRALTGGSPRLSGCGGENFKLVATITEGYDPSWKGERGRIDEGMLKRHVPDVSSARYYIAGPPAMVAATWQMLIGMGVEDGAIKTEEFSGY